MPKINRSALMPFAAQYMYDIVNDVSAYPDFLPWCGGAKILSSGEGYREAAVLIKKGPLNHWFSTRNQLTKNARIDMRLVDGPFKKLQGAWEFRVLDDEACKILLNLEFEFSNGLTAALLTPVFSQIANTMVDSFCARAQEIHTA
ncbi:MAG: type II toxin-antitoxin system RatA family toxin [Gammaproteobacteria bacterium]|nr:type II toxin-antitoxin system RatA family toxin [Gammaproteobacteria bacterium]